MRVNKKLLILIFCMLISLGTMVSCQNEGQADDMFPQSTTLNSLLSSYTINKISITDGNTGEVRQTSDSAEIEQLLKILADEKFIRNDNNKKGTRAGYSYFIDFYFQNIQGYYRYTLACGFTKSDNFSGSIPTGDCYAENAVKETVEDFYNSLKS